MQEQRFSDAIRFGLEIVRLQPTSAKAALNLGIVYKGAGEAAEAEYQLNRAIELDPALRQAYIELATLCVSEQKADEARAIVDRYLKFRPQDIMFRLQRERMN
jgi:Flp pilus assembly protein TadD